MVRTVRFAVDGERARSADSFATIGIERDRLFAFQKQALVHDIEHFEQRSLRRNVGRVVTDELAVRLRVRLTPNSQAEVHG